MAAICGSIARSFGRKSRVGQLSMMAGAMAQPSMSASDWVAKMTRGVLLAQRLQPFAQLAGEAVVVERQPALVDDEQGRPAVEPVLDAVEEIGEHGGRGARADQALGLEGLDLGFAKPLALRRRAAGPRDRRASRAAAPASARSTAAAPTGRSACAPSTGAEASEVSADQRCSFTSGVIVTLLAGRGASRSIRPPRRVRRRRRSRASG